MAREVAVTWLGELKAEVRVGPHRFVADEPREQGGDDTGPTPIELLLAALGT
jgi:putative redox protein